MLEQAPGGTCDPTEWGLMLEWLRINCSLWEGLMLVPVRLTPHWDREGVGGFCPREEAVAETTGDELTTTILHPAVTFLGRRLRIQG